MREPRKRAKVTCARSGGAVRMSGHVLALALFLCPLAASVPARAEEPSIDVLVDRVRNGAPEAFEQALAVLSEMGAEAAEAVPQLIDNLDPPDDGRRAKLSATLIAIGEPAVPALVRGLMSWSGHTRIWCMRTLGELGAAGAPAVLTLAESLDGAHPETQLEILRALAGIGEAASAALPQVRPLVGSSSGAVRVEAVRTLGRLGPQAQSLLVELATSSDAAVAAEARKALGRTAPAESGPSAATVERLSALLRKGSETLRIEAARAIGVLGPKAVALLPVLEEALGDSSVHVRRAVIRALAGLGPAADPAVDRLMALFAEDAEVRTDILRTLPFLGAAAERTIPQIARWLEDGELRTQAASALSRFGEAAVPQLAEAARHTSFHVRQAALWALAAVDRAVEQRLPVFVAALEDEASSIRYAACDALAALAERAKPAIAALRERLADDVEGVRVAAARAMYEAGERGDELAPALIEGLTSRTIVLFEDMDERLVALGAKAVPALADSMGRMEAVWLGEVCARIGKPAIPAMLRGLENPKPSSRRAALEALRAVEADGVDLLAPIAARLKDEDRTVRAAAARALVPFAKTCPDALVERALPVLLAFFDRKAYYSDEQQAVHEALIDMGSIALPALKRRLETKEDAELRQLVHQIEDADSD